MKPHSLRSVFRVDVTRVRMEDLKEGDRFIIITGDKTDHMYEKKNVVWEATSQPYQVGSSEVTEPSGVETSIEEVAEPVWAINSRPLYKKEDVDIALWNINGKDAV